MDASPPPRKIEDHAFLALVILITVAFAFILEPYFQAILWGVIIAILFQPVHREIRDIMPRWPSAAAGLTLLLIIALVIVPALLLTIALIQEASVFYARIQSGEINFAQLFDDLRASMPAWSESWLQRYGLDNFNAAQERLREAAADSFQFVAAQAVNIGQSAFSLFIAFTVMLYLTYFLLRDGETLMESVIKRTPLRDGPRRELLRQFVLVIRATVKGSIIVAIVQGFIGGVVFWLLGVEGALLWGVMMGFFSLLPAVGTGIVWVPVAVYLLVSGALAQALILIFCGIFVIGMVDNLLRPILVGRDTRMPDYLVLITTLGGLQLFGFSGLVIGPVIAALFIATWNIVAGMRGQDEAALPITEPDDLPDAASVPVGEVEARLRTDATGTQKPASSPQGG
ncbi:MULTISPECIES: AI-2E family transporter [Sphingobium]|uniref:AI-2E family transporter n=2 Tax=Sphingomonadaceae TaxID=41297 RepID=UPI0015EC149A|nr:MULTISPECIES: AI-2E family transporter [Sphingobium]MCW2363229.1 putative PurR-regulated permease PerM [Sphingobium sp. B10D3B]MCW2383057.1 putative PurR-regulated permease PerM [Sphingobium sp. B2D3B]MCW2399967.1 putative PurR-regulated permease PerM [Sphingobium sp. B2D3C]MCW2407069.1 putative PurR-regulated permease PerM [Sphingobium xanthum]MCW2410692.1 putative PurR-regulated permease PerM [Sphingobium sp. B8D3D]